MKKIKKSDLALKKEVVSYLTDGELQSVAGGDARAGTFATECLCISDNLPCRETLTGELQCCVVKPPETYFCESVAFCAQTTFC